MLSQKDDTMQNDLEISPMSAGEGAPHFPEILDHHCHRNTKNIEKNFGGKGRSLKILGPASFFQKKICIVQCLLKDNDKNEMLRSSIPLVYILVRCSMSDSDNTSWRVSMHCVT